MRGGEARTRSQSDERRSGLVRSGPEPVPRDATVAAVRERHRRQVDGLAAYVAAKAAREPPPIRWRTSGPPGISTSPSDWITRPCSGSPPEGRAGAPRRRRRGPGSRSYATACGPSRRSACCACRRSAPCRWSTPSCECGHGHLRVWLDLGRATHCGLAGPEHIESASTETGTTVTRSLPFQSTLSPYFNQRHSNP